MEGGKNKSGIHVAHRDEKDHLKERKTRDLKKKCLMCSKKVNTCSNVIICMFFVESQSINKCQKFVNKLEKEKRL